MPKSLPIPNRRITTKERNALRIVKGLILERMAEVYAERIELIGRIADLNKTCESISMKAFVELWNESNDPVS